MNDLNIPFDYRGTQYAIDLAFVAGTPADDPFLFGTEQAISIPDFYIAKFQTTQALWKFIMGDEANRSANRGDRHPVEHVSWNGICGPGGFLDKINERFKDFGTFRLPSETEWEYAARGGSHWHDGYIFAGSNDIKEVAWYEGNSGPYALTLVTGLKNTAKLTRTHPVGQKKANQLGLYDMNGNLWEWCRDWFIPDAGAVPKDGSPYFFPTNEKVLRGGCHHNWAVHCTNTKRYAIGPQFFDGCIGFRLALFRDS
ncbi:formylglycine-generating enzyme family protein [Hufsiella ginkgonis]|uniref:SUMF1/EgtB/PvdO family nonheme iron enzyme n=1 Tax=Hufsiella ginkgonis TaxID=2695274 RepID=A0A7K1XWH5_9SPHI|nr:formylglycine-generating enzyme family protein [Hufsiella ginkgonis]MXV15353.1 SUMF1/EgtB/PvdO family nonheme iron enzyme [Hufsiella ginkgonis]